MRQEGFLTAYCDGAYNWQECVGGVGVLLLREDGSEVCGMSKQVRCWTQNEAEYLAVIEAALLAEKHHALALDVYSDSMLVVYQIAGRWRVLASSLGPLCDRACELLGSFPAGWTISHIPGSENRRADRLARASVRYRGPKRTLDVSRQKQNTIS